MAGRQPRSYDFNDLNEFNDFNGFNDFNDLPVTIYDLTNLRFDESTNFLIGGELKLVFNRK